MDGFTKCYSMKKMSQKLINKCFLKFSIFGFSFLYNTGSFAGVVIHCLPSWPPCILEQQSWQSVGK